MIGAVLLLGLGLALVVAEILFPSFGILSVLATLALVGACVLAFREGSDVGFPFLGATMVLLPLAIVLGLKVLPQSPLGRYMVAQGLSFESTPSTDPRDPGLVGERGTAESDCRPAGVARLAGRRVDVVTRGEWLEAGTPLRVVDVSGNRVVVARAEAPPAAASPDPASARAPTAAPKEEA